MKHIFLFILILIPASFAINAQEVVSPNKKIKVELLSKKTSDNALFNRVYFRILYKNNSGYVEVLPSHLWV